VLLGLLAAIAWAAAGLLATGVARRHGADVVIFWTLVSGAVLGVGVAVALEPWRIDLSDLVRVVIAGVGLVLAWWAFVLGVRRGPVGAVAAVSATDGAIAAGVAMGLGERVSALAVGCMAVVVAGVMVVSVSGGSSVLGRLAPAAVGFGLLSATGFATFLVSTGGLDRIGPLWATGMTRVSALAVIGPVLMLRSRPLVPARQIGLSLLSGVLTSAGVLSFLIAARHGIAVPSVMASSYAAWTGLGGVLLMSEKIHKGQVLGVVVIMLGMAGLALARA
jgi:drug/metabolite transporter (DMT)-like permease